MAPSSNAHDVPFIRVSSTLCHFIIYLINGSIPAEITSITLPRNWRACTVLEVKIDIRYETKERLSTWQPGGGLVIRWTAFKIAASG